MNTKNQFSNKPLPPHKVQQFIENVRVLDELAKPVSNIEILKSYKGFGGLKRCFWDKNLYGQLMRAIRANVGVDKEKTTLESLRNTSSSAYYTPQAVIDFMYRYLEQVCNFKGGDILEPSCGNGAFFEYMPEHIKANSKITAVEYDTLTAKLVGTLYADIEVINQPLQEVNFSNKKYDLIIGNPPYSAEKVNDTAMEDISGYTIHNYFIARAVRLLKDNGLLAFVMPSFFMDKPKGHTRHIVDNEAVIIDVVRLPDNLFDQATVTVDLVFIRKTGKKIHDITNTMELMQGNAKDEINQFWIKNPNRVLGELKLKWVECYKNYVPTCQTQNKEQALKYLAVCDFKQETIENYKTITSNSIAISSNNTQLPESLYHIFLEVEKEETALRNDVKTLIDRVNNLADTRNRLFDIIARLENLAA